jgi:excisionase family DNA binding protein
MSDEHSEPAIELPVLTVKEVAAYLHVHTSTICRLIKRHELPGFRIGGQWRFKVEEIDRWRAAGENTAVYGAGAKRTGS